MFKLSIQADEEMRKMIREEVKGAIITLTKEEIATQVKEAFRRIMGKNDSLGPFIQLQASSIIKVEVYEQLKGFSARHAAKEAIRDEVLAAVTQAISTEIRAEISKVDVAALVKKSLGSLTIHAGSV